MIYECTDCEHVANFCDGYRIFCMAQELPPDEVCKYYPVDAKDAIYCEEFTEGDGLWLSLDDLKEALRCPDAMGRIESYDGVRAWVREHRLPL